MSPVSFLKRRTNEPLVKLERKLWLTADKSEVVEDGDPAAAFLLGLPGDEIPVSEAHRLGIKARPAKPAKEAEPEGNKEAPPGADKEAAPAGNKGRATRAKSPRAKSPRAKKAAAKKAAAKKAAAPKPEGGDA